MNLIILEDYLPKAISNHFHLISGTASAVVIASFLYWRRNRWINVGQVDQIYIHPLKGGRGLLVPDLECKILGPRRDCVLDRGFIVGNSQGAAVDIRGSYKKVVLINLSHTGGGWWELQAPGVKEMCRFLSPFSDEESSQKVTLKLLDIEVTGLDCGDGPAQWLSNFLGDDFRLIQHSQEDFTDRKPRAKYVKAYPKTFPASCVPMFADVTPYMMTTQPSLLDLRSRLPGHVASQVTQRTFRPNIVIGGDNLQPWQEDGWVGEMMIGSTLFTYNKDCTRCIGTKINPETGDLYDDNEPLQTLKTFRQHDKSHQIIRRAVGDSPVFGMHYSVISPGQVKLGDTVWVRKQGRLTDQGMETYLQKIKSIF